MFNLSHNPAKKTPTTLTTPPLSPSFPRLYIYIYIYILFRWDVPRRTWTRASPSTRQHRKSSSPWPPGALRTAPGVPCSASSRGSLSLAFSLLEALGESPRRDGGGVGYVVLFLQYLSRGDADNSTCCGKDNKHHSISLIVCAMPSCTVASIG